MGSILQWQNPYSHIGCTAQQNKIQLLLTRIEGKDVRFRGTEPGILWELQLQQHQYVSMLGCGGPMVRLEAKAQKHIVT